MQWSQLLSANRLGEREVKQSSTYRTPFHRDHDKILFSGAFRRLGRKTQVHTLSSNDHVHTRLTHSLEVGCVGRTLGMMIGARLQASNYLPENRSPADLGAIVQAACLAHDIGNPPFGHASEFAISDWFQTHTHYLKPLSEIEKADILYFEGNAQGLRMVTQIEYNQFMGGMRLSVATLGSVIKYPWTVNYLKNGKYGIYQSEKEMMQQLASQLGLIELKPNKWCRHPLAYLTEAADDLCYAIIDLEDGVEMELLRYSDVEPIMQKLSQSTRPEAAKLYSDRRRLASWRGDVIEKAVLAVCDVFIQMMPRVLDGEDIGHIVDHCPDYIKEGIQEAKELARKKVFSDRRKTHAEIGAFSVMSTLLTAYCDAVYELKTTGSNHFRNEKLLSLIGNNVPKTSDSWYEAYRRILDYISGMTDSYALDLAQKISGNSSLV